MTKNNAMTQKITKILNDWTGDEGNWADLMPEGTHKDDELSCDADYLCTITSTGEAVYWSASNSEAYIF